MILKEFFTVGEQGFEQQKNYNAEEDISIRKKIIMLKKTYLYWIKKTQEKQD